ncbi:MAG: M28 family peptidase [Oscillospiraceae bacterium]|nr:M28 family peptidase [Oscillospiraceae bacterium]
MLTKPIDILQLFPIRKSKTQKEAFRTAVQSYGESLGYKVTVEKGSFGSRNVVIGDPENAKYLVTAHYDTPASIGLPNFITPCNPFVYILWQFVLVGALVVISILAGLVFFLITGNDAWAPTAALTVYWVLLLLMMFGPANKSNANDNTSGVVTVLEIAASIPQIHRNKVCFVLFDLEEAGLIGSASYRSSHKKATQDQIVLNLDCVGDGDHILFFPTKKLKRDRRKLNPIYTCCGQFGKKYVSIRDRGFAVYPSDQKNFPYAVGIAALNKGKVGLYMSRIHTKKDVCLDQTNVNILRAAICTLISCDAAQ